MRNWYVYMLGFICLLFFYFFIILETNPLMLGAPKPSPTSRKLGGTLHFSKQRKQVLPKGVGFGLWSKFILHKWLVWPPKPWWEHGCRKSMGLCWSTELFQLKNIINIWTLLQINFPDRCHFQLLSAFCRRCFHTPTLTGCIIVSSSLNDLLLWSFSEH